MEKKYSLECWVSAVIFRKKPPRSRRNKQLFVRWKNWLCPMGASGNRTHNNNNNNTRLTCGLKPVSDVGGVAISDSRAAWKLLHRAPRRSSTLRHPVSQAQTQAHQFLLIDRSFRGSFLRPGSSLLPLADLPNPRTRSTLRYFDREFS